MQLRAAPLMRLLVVAVLALAGTGCARLFGSYDLAPNGLASGEDRLRRMLSTGQAATAFQRFEQSAPDDEVLRALYQGVVAYHSGDYEHAARVFDVAGEMADDRVTKSVSRSALSLISNDMALPYEPGRTERLMIPYYAALARTRMGDVSGAAVEARRLSALLQRYHDDGARLDARTAATLHRVAAAMFEANGNTVEADVALRIAGSLDSTLVRNAPAAGTGAVFIILEQGFVAHRVEQGLAVMLLPEEVHAIAHGDAELKATAAGFVAGRILERAVQPAYVAGPYRRSVLHVPAPDHTTLPGYVTRTVCEPAAQPANGQADTARATLRPTRNAAPVCREERERIDELPYLLKVAWPAYRSEYGTPAAARLVGSDTTAFAAPADLSRGVIADFESERALIIARTIVRGTAKLALTRSAESRLEEKNEAAGRILGLLGNVGNVLLERADTRSWHLLPASVSVARVDLAPGEHELSLDVGGRSLALGTVTVQPHRTIVLPVRAW